MLLKCENEVVIDRLVQIAHGLDTRWEAFSAKNFLESVLGHAEPAALVELVLIPRILYPSGLGGTAWGSGNRLSFFHFEESKLRSKLKPMVERGDVRAIVSDLAIAVRPRSSFTFLKYFTTRGIADLVEKHKRIICDTFTSGGALSRYIAAIFRECAKYITYGTHYVLPTICFSQPIQFVALEGMQRVRHPF